MKNKVAVIAGTAVDTEMGADYLRLHTENCDIYPYPVSKDPQEQTNFQISAGEYKEKIIGGIFASAKNLGVENFFIYCNSLSGTVDFYKLAAEYGVNVVTPLAAYTELAHEYSRLGVIAANNQSLAGIENAVLAGNPDAEVIGASLLPIVKDIENRLSPQEIVRRWQLPELIGFFENAGAEIILLGCTHFPWFEEEFCRYAHVEAVNPASHMLKMLSKYLN